jgi:undecaprenyl-diphosphatase
VPDWVYAVILGVIEGLTEFIPVSSTGMMLLAKHGMGLTDPFWNTFAVMIQLGAILAVVVLYFRKLWGAVVTLPSDPASRRFALSVIVAFIPSIVLGLLLHDFIKGVLFDSPQVQCISLIIGGVVLLLIDRMAPAPVHHEPDQLPLKTSFIIGLFQVIAMMPGVSRSGATIVGGMLNRVDKRAAAEFTFFLAIPTMLGAFVLDAIESKDQLLAGHNTGLLAIGFVTAFVVALGVIKLMLAVVTRRGFAPFGWLRIAIGVGGLLALQFG